MPPVLLVATVCVLSWLPAVLLIGRRLSLLRQALVIGLSECALHALFTLAATPPGSTMPVPPAPMAAMPGMGTGPVVAMPAMPMPAPGMWLAHAAAALLTVLAWNRGEAAFWALAGLAARLRRAVVPARIRSGTSPRRSLQLLRIEAVPSFHLARVLEVSARRGPPVPVPQH